MRLFLCEVPCVRHFTENFWTMDLNEYTSKRHYHLMYSLRSIGSRHSLKSPVAAHNSLVFRLWPVCQALSSTSASETAGLSSPDTQRVNSFAADVSCMSLPKSLVPWRHPGTLSFYISALVSTQLSLTVQTVCTPHSLVTIFLKSTRSLSLAAMSDCLNSFGTNYKL